MDADTLALTLLEIRRQTGDDAEAYDAAVDQLADDLESGEGEPGQRFSTQPEDALDWIEMFSASRRSEGEEWETNGRYYRRQGGRTVRIPAPSQGADADPAATRVPPGRRRARSRIQGLVSRLAGRGGQPLTEADFTDLAEGLQTLTVPQLRQARQALAASFGGGTRKEQMVEALRAHVRGMAPAPAEPEVPEDEGIDLGDRGVEEATFIPDEPKPPPAPAPRPMTPQRFVEVLRGASPDAEDIEQALALMTLPQQQEVRQLLGLPFSRERANIRDPQQYARSLAEAIVEQRRTAPTPQPQPPAPPRPTAADVRVPGIEGKAADPPALPTNARVNLRGKEADVRRIFGRDLPPELLSAMSNGFDGSTTSTTNAYGSDLSLNTRAPGLIADRTFKRHRNGKVECHNDLFVTEPDSAYDGHGVAMFLNQVRALRAGGVDYITTHAAGDFYGSQRGGMNGYITWPKFGYDGTISEVYFRRLPPEMKRKLGSKRNVQSLMALPGGPEAWELYGGSITDGKFDLTEGSDSMKRLDAYVAKRQAQPDRPRRARGTGRVSEAEINQKKAALEAKIREKIATWETT